VNASQEHQAAQTGMEAAQVLSNNAYIAAMASLKAQVVTQWKECPIRDREGQMLLLQLAKLTDKFDAILTGYVEAGKLASHKIEVDGLRNESKLGRTLRRVMG
jgi:hypothetical protein